MLFAVLWTMIFFDQRSYGERRTELRHGGGHAVGEAGGPAADVQPIPGGSTSST